MASWHHGYISYIMVISTNCLPHQGQLCLIDGVHVVMQGGGVQRILAGGKPAPNPFRNGL